MKMKSDYTLYNQSSIQNYSSIDNVDQAVEYLKDPTHFRSFGQGLTELLQKKNAPVDFSDNTEMADYLFSKLKDIGSTISRATVMSWFTGNHRPKVEAGFFSMSIMTVLLTATTSVKQSIIILFYISFLIKKLRK